MAYHSFLIVYHIVGRNVLGSIGSYSEERTLLTLMALVSDTIFHWYIVSGLPLDVFNISNKLLKWTCNCGETHIVCRFRIKSTDDTCLGEVTRLIPILVLASHLCCRPPS